MKRWLILIVVLASCASPADQSAHQNFVGEVFRFSLTESSGGNELPEEALQAIALNRWVETVDTCNHPFLPFWRGRHAYVPTLCGEPPLLSDELQASGELHMVGWAELECIYEQDRRDTGETVEACIG